MNLRVRSVIPALVAVLVLAACGGSTRFVVVENKEVAPAAAPSGVDATTATSAPAGGSEPGGGRATRAEHAEIEELIGVVFSDEATPLATRLARVVDGDDLGPTVRAVLDIVKSTGADVTVDRVTVAGDDATATVSVTVGGEPFAADLPIALVRVAGEWKVTRAGACTVLALASSCPEAPVR